MYFQYRTIFKVQSTEINLFLNYKFFYILRTFVSFCGLKTSYMKMSGTKFLRYFTKFKLSLKKYISHYIEGHRKLQALQSHITLFSTEGYVAEYTTLSELELQKQKSSASVRVGKRRAVSERLLCGKYLLRMNSLRSVLAD